MSRVYSDTVLPEDSGINQDQTLGTTGDSVVVTAGASLNVNTVKDSGGNTIFTSDGSGNLSSMNSSFGKSPKLLTTNTVTGGALSAFTSGIDSTYKLYIFEYININPATDGAFFSFQGSIDGGSNYNLQLTATYIQCYNPESGSTSALAYDTGYDQGTGTNYQYLSGSIGNLSAENMCGILYLFEPSSTTFYKQWYSDNQTYKLDLESMYNGVAGYFMTTTAINAVSFKMSTGNFDGVIKMYGIS